jgi:hypothetical protein
MTYRGHIKNGVVVLDEGSSLPEGTEVLVHRVGEAEVSTQDTGETLGQRLLKLAGRAKGLPSEASINHDHYLYGTPKK